MNTETKVKHPVRTALIIVTFVFAVALVAWLSIKIVNSAPGSFASLASLAESVKEYDANNAEENTNNSSNDLLIVTSDTNVVVAGEQVRIAWTEATVSGSYVFSYGCTDGVAIDLRDASGEKSISCNTNYNLGNVNNVSLKIDSEKERYVDIPYTLSFLATNDTEPRASDDAILTVVNNKIQSDEPKEETTIPAEEPTVAVTPSTPDSVSPTPSTPSTPTTPTTPTYTQEFTYEIPVSNPNGKTDLATKFLNIGKIVNNKFVVGTVDNDDAGAIQFEVKNFGTKTSEKWTYTVTLPSGGLYESKEQTALKPNERAVITIGFPESTETNYTFKVEITVKNDSNQTNNKFSQAVKFVE